MQACSPYGKAICERTGGVTTENDHQDTCKADDTYGDSNVCSNYYKCVSGKWTLSKCQNNQYYDTVTKKCVDRQKATPVNTCDRCQFTYSKWVNAVDSKCSKFLTCKDGKKVSEGSCGSNSYFNEQTQVCLTGTTNLAKYAEENGACKCGLQCQIEECKDDDCKKELCENKRDSPECDCVVNPSKGECQLKACKDNQKCKKLVCQNPDPDYPLPKECDCILEPDTIGCQLEPCKDNLECKLKICQIDDNKNKDECKCIVDSKGIECKIVECKNKHSGDNQKLEECKLELLDSCKPSDSSCKSKVCADPSMENTDECKFVACESDKDNLSSCLNNVCDSKTDGKENCQKKACDHYDDKEGKAKCKIDLCLDESCKKEACEDTSISETTRCTLVNCDPKVIVCKINACEGKKELPECAGFV